MQVQKLRLQRGWSQQQLAELSGLSVRTIQRIESGQPASTETLKSLASVFEIDFSQLHSESLMNIQSVSAADEMLAMSHVRQLRRFYISVFVYVVVNTLLATINLSTAPKVLWFIWPLLGWGVALLARAAVLFELVPFFGAEWEKRQIEKRLGRPL